MIFAQLDLFAAPHNGSETSRAAAEAVVESGQGVRQTRAVLYALRLQRKNGLTRKELAHATGIVESTVCARVGWLLESGLAMESGTRVPAGGARSQKIVHITEAGLREYLRGVTE